MHCFPNVLHSYLHYCYFIWGGGGSRGVCRCLLGIETPQAIRMDPSSLLWARTQRDVTSLKPHICPLLRGRSNNHPCLEMRHKEIKALVQGRGWGSLSAHSGLSGLVSRTEIPLSRETEQPAAGGRQGSASVLTLRLRTSGSLSQGTPLPLPGCVIFSGTGKGEG